MEIISYIYNVVKILPIKLDNMTSEDLTVKEQRALRALLRAYPKISEEEMAIFIHLFY